jgi:hypothetical protein
VITPVPRSQDGSRHRPVLACAGGSRRRRGDAVRRPLPRSQGPRPGIRALGQRGPVRTPDGPRAGRPGGRRPGEHHGPRAAHRLPPRRPTARRHRRGARALAGLVARPRRRGGGGGGGGNVAAVRWAVRRRPWPFRPRHVARNADRAGPPARPGRPRPRLDPAPRLDPCDRRVGLPRGRREGAPPAAATEAVLRASGPLEWLCRASAEHLPAAHWRNRGTAMATDRPTVRPSVSDGRAGRSNRCTQPVTFPHESSQPPHSLRCCDDRLNPRTRRAPSANIARGPAARVRPAHERGDRVGRMGA